MPISAIIKQECPKCGKLAVEESRSDFLGVKLVKLKCGHEIFEESLKTTKAVIKNIKGDKELMPFQYDGVNFAAEANVRCLIADEQGLGKTVQAIGLVKIFPKELLPAVIVVPSSVKLQWHKQIIDWCGVQGYLTQTMRSGKELAAPGFDIYITTYDLIKDFERVFAIVKGDIKLLVLDEVQKIKNHSGERAKAIERFVVSYKIEHILALSGTPIENNAGEYFTVLNLLRPNRFPVYQRYIDTFVDSYSSGWGQKLGGLKNKDYFHEETKDIVIRRKLDEVLKDFPEFRRDFYHVELDKKYNKAYAKGIEDLERLMYDEEMDKLAAGAAKIAIMSRLRHITGLSKVDQCVDYVKEFLESSNERKLVIFTHHLDVAEQLLSKVNEIMDETGNQRCAHYHSGLNTDAREELKQTFIKSKQRILIASTQAAGIGLDGLQHVADTFVMLERQWNPSKENQAEKRLHRFGQTRPVTGVYMIASETIDEYFTELVETKRAYVGQALDNEEIQWDESSLMTELATILITKGKKKWVL